MYPRIKILEKYLVFPISFTMKKSIGKIYPKIAINAVKANASSTLTDPTQKNVKGGINSVNKDAKLTN